MDIYFFVKYQIQMLMPEIQLDPDLAGSDFCCNCSTVGP